MDIDINGGVINASGAKVACDRCRGQKQRCVWPPRSTQCHRCMRAKAECKVPPARPMGRPPRQFRASVVGANGSSGSSRNDGNNGVSVSTSSEGQYTTQQALTLPTLPYGEHTEMEMQGHPTSDPMPIDSRNGMHSSHNPVVGTNASTGEILWGLTSAPPSASSVSMTPVVSSPFSITQQPNLLELLDR